MLVPFKGHNGRLLLVDSINVTALVEEANGNTSIYMYNHMTALVTTEHISVVAWRISPQSKIDNFSYPLTTAFLPEVTMDELRQAQLLTPTTSTPTVPPRGNILPTKKPIPQRRRPLQ